MSWNIAETLAQDKIWVMQDGRRMLIVDMDQNHRLNTRAYLLRRAKEIHEHVRRLRVRATVNGFRHLDDPHMLVGKEVFVEIEMDPERWLLATPFMTELDRVIRAHGVEDGEVVSVTYADECTSMMRRLIAHANMLEIADINDGVSGEFR